MGPVHFGEHTFIFDRFAGIPTSPENLAQRWWGGGETCVEPSNVVLNTLPSNEVK